jgi:hypothetical protein
MFMLILITLRISGERQLAEVRLHAIVRLLRVLKIDPHLLRYE